MIAIKKLKTQNMKSYESFSKFDEIKENIQAIPERGDTENEIV